MEILIAGEGIGLFVLNVHKIIIPARKLNVKRFGKNQDQRFAAEASRNLLNAESQLVGGFADILSAKVDQQNVYLGL